MAHHYEAWSEVFSDLTQDFMDQNHLEVAISDLEHGVSHGRTNEYVQDDIKCLKEIMRVSVRKSMSMFSADRNLLSSRPSSYPKTCTKTLPLDSDAANVSLPNH